MPELPEVEQFRKLLEIALVANEDDNLDDDDDDERHCLQLQRHSLDKNPPRKFISDDDIELINNGRYKVVQARRKGKQLCLDLQKLSKESSAATTTPKKKKAKRTQSGGKAKKAEQLKTNNDSASTKSTENDDDYLYLFLHMGMTGSISIPSYIPKLMEVKHTTEFPPPYTYLKLSVGTGQACYSDPRKFGSVVLKDSDDEFHQLAPDAWTDLNPTALEQEDTVVDDGDDETTTAADVCSTTSGIVTSLTNKSTGIKAMLLDQKRAISGVGNWVADEVMYQTQMHPDQNYLAKDTVQTLLLTLHRILDTAVDCLYRKTEFPNDWLFHYRWSNKGKGSTTKDSMGRTVTFVTSGGRTSAIVASIQKLKKGQKKKMIHDEAVSTKSKKGGKSSSSSSSRKKQTKGKRDVTGDNESSLEKKVATTAASKAKKDDAELSNKRSSKRRKTRSK